MLRADLGQLLWYCSCRNTRFTFHVSNRELVLVKFARNPERSADQDIITPIKNAVDAAQISISRAVYADPPNAPDALSRRAGEGGRDGDEDTEEVEDYSEGDEDYEPLSPEDRIQLSEAGSNVVAYVQSVPFGGEEALNCGLALLGFILTAFEQDNSPGGLAI